MTSFHDYAFSDVENEQRRMLCKKIEEQGYRNTMEEIAYTWFNRFCAIRFMEVNGYLPSHVRVFSDDDDKFNPQIMSEAINLDFVDVQLVYNLHENNKNEELYRYLLITQCNELSNILPGMFQRINDYTELLLPDYLLRDESVIKAMVEQIPQEDWTEQVQILGWLYQYYNSEPKDKVFADLKKNVKISKENIPAATQLFTPDWIVRYMVENSLGRMWAEGHGKPENAEWKYYLDEAEQEDSVKAKLEEIRAEYKNLQPEDIKCIDPCMGSGHILCYMFDVLVQIYEDYGYSAREAAEKILTHNLYGLDIDERAAQLAYFAVMMKARQYDRRFFARNEAKAQPHVFAVRESNFLDMNAVHHLTEGDEKAQAAMDTLIAQMKDAKTYGSLLRVEGVDFALLHEKLDEHAMSLFDMNEVSAFVQAAEMLSMEYDVVVTNPPYMGGSGMNTQLAEFVKRNFADYKSDLFSAFIVRCTQMAKPSGYLGFLSPYVWMFIQSYEKMRNYIYSQKTIETLIQFEYSAFEEATVPICTFVLKNSKVNKNGCYLRLTDFRGGMEVQRKKTLEAITNHNCGFYYEANQENFSKIPGSPVAYWVGENFVRAFENPKLYEYSISPSQNITGNNNKYVRKFWELEKSKIGGKDDWIFYAKGGGYRKWWGNLTDIVDWTPTARYTYQHGDGKHASQIINKDYWYKKGITWGLITSALPSFRIMPEGATYDKGGSTIIVDTNVYNFTLAFLNCKVYYFIATVLNPTLNFQVKDICSSPIILKEKEKIDLLVQENIDLSKSDWDSFETSWDFERHPLV
jgi:hypothetical protein